MDPEDRLRRRSTARGELLRSHSGVLAESPRRCTTARLRRDSAETFRAGATGGRFPDSGTGGARQGGVGELVWDCVARVDGVAGDCGEGRENVGVRCGVT